jgi:hypothetical protein
MSATDDGYRKKQVPLVILVFICIGVAFWFGSAPVSVGAIMAACLLAFWAAKMEPAKSPDEHHHH